jgi:hypothetical protein
MKQLIFRTTMLALAFAAACDPDSPAAPGPDDSSAGTGGGGKAGSASGGDASAGDASAGDASAGDASAGDASAGDASGGDAGGGGTGGGDAGGGDAGGGDAGGGDAGGGDAGDGDTGGVGGAGDGDAGSSSDAAGDGGQSGNAGSGTGTGTSVMGRVTSEVDLPLAGVTVMIGGATVATNAAGEFTITNVPEAYDAVVINEEGSRETAVVFQALTRRDPVFRFTRPEGTEHAPTLSGTTEVPGSETVELLFGSSAVWKVTRVLSNGTFSMLPRWSGPESTTGTLHLLRWTATGGAPSNYTGYGSIPLTLTGENQQVTVQASPVASGAVSGTLVLPSGYAAGGRAFYAVLDVHTSHHITSFSSTSPLFEDVVTPAVPGAQIQIWGNGSAGDGGSVRSIRHYSPTESGIELDVPEAPVLTLPADDELGITTETPFVWAPLGGAAGVCILEIRAGSRWIRVVTSETTTTIPDIPGYALPADTTISWTVQCYAPFGGVDAFAGPEASVDIPEFKRITRVRTDMQHGSAFPRQFQTGP